MAKQKKQFSCNQDSQTGVISCESFRQFDDGGRESLAKAEFQFDAQCRPIPTHLEGQEGELENLRKWVMPMLRTKCKNLPKDY